MRNQIKDILKNSNELKPIPTGIKTFGVSLTKVKAVIFDLYGTLLISGSGDVGTAMTAGSSEAFSEALHRCGLSDVPSEISIMIKDRFFNLISETHKQMKNIGYEYPEIDIVTIWSEIIKTSELIHLIPELKTISPDTVAAAYESTVNPVYPMPGTKTLLNYLSTNSYKMGIISNAQFYTPLIFENFFHGGFDGLGFDKKLCLFSYIERRSKPDMFLFDKLSASLSDYDIKPQEVVFIGNDMLKDIMPSVKAGYKTVLFAGDKRSLRLRNDIDACSTIKPDAIVDNLLDLIDFFQEGQ